MPHYWRNAFLLFGLFFIYAVAGGLLGYASNFVGGHYIASSDQPGSIVWMFLRGGVPRALAAGGVGALAQFVFVSRRKARWAGALAVLIGLYALAGWSFGFAWQALDAESRIGWILQAVFIGGSAFLAFAIAARFASRGDATAENQVAV